MRGELFADHYSQARQFYRSQTPVEQTHIKDSFVFELSKVETPAIRARVVSHLLTIDQTLAQKVADGLGLAELPEAAKPARPLVEDLPASPALSILLNPPKDFSGRKVGVLVSDGVDGAFLDEIERLLTAEGAQMEVIAPRVGGFTAKDGTLRPAHQKVNGAPSVLYDAVAVLLSTEGAKLLLNEATAKDFVSDAFAHAKVIAFTQAAQPLLEKAGVIADEGCLLLDTPAKAETFLGLCRKGRRWEREAKVHAV